MTNQTYADDSQDPNTATKYVKACGNTSVRYLKIDDNRPALAALTWWPGRASTATVASNVTAVSTSGKFMNK